MKSELYKVIYRVAVFCVIATLGLAGGGIALSLHVCSGVGYAFGTRILSWSVAGLGIVLWIAAIVTAIYFYRKYKAQLAQEQMQREEENRIAHMETGTEDNEA